MVVVIPAYEPDEKLIQVVNGFLTQEIALPVVVVDDGSGEACAPVFSALEQTDGVTVLRHPHNRGKGAALKTAFAYIADHYSADEGILTVDADGQHLLPDCLKVCEAFRAQPDVLITGSRRFQGEVPLRSRFGNAVTRGVFHLTTGHRVYDTQTGLRAFSVSRVPQMLALHGDRYEYEIHQLLHCCTSDTGVYEVPIETVYINDNSSSHFDTLRDSIKIYKVIFKFLGPTFLKFMSTSFVSFLVDFFSFCILFYGTVALFAGWDMARSMFSFSRDVTTEWADRLLAINPYIFAGGGSMLRAVCLVLSRVISSLCNYLMNRRFVFDGVRKDNNLFRYAVAAVTVLALNAVFMELFTLLGTPAWLSVILSQLVCYPVSFFLQRTFVFKKRKDSVHGK